MIEERQRIIHWLIEAQGIIDVNIADSINYSTEDLIIKYGAKRDKIGVIPFKSEIMYIGEDYKFVPIDYEIENSFLLYADKIFFGGQDLLPAPGKDKHWDINSIQFDINIPYEALIKATLRYNETK